ncbi:sterol desaturase family protein [Aquimarina hainanensis]|uniref:sterol desaturase family protein n=1 Tax=Aquimarina hainanensis TaxID=1578017 RepID=UPI00360E8A56
MFNTPSVHRVHHGSNDKYLDKNYGGVLIIWDKLFGTFQREEEKVVYGLTKNIKSNNPITINFIEYKNIWKDVKRCRNWKDRFRVVFGDLQWRPSYFKEEKE